MKKFSAFFFYTIIVMTGISCMHNDHDISITYSDSDNSYSMKAYFNKNSTRDVEKYMDYKIGKRSKMSFVNSRIDGTIALDDRTKFYIKKLPGILEIRLDKDENTYESYEQIRSMCQGIKNVVTH